MADKVVNIIHIYACMCVHIYTYKHTRMHIQKL